MSIASFTTVILNFFHKIKFYILFYVNILINFVYNTYKFNFIYGVIIVTLLLFVLILLLYNSLQDKYIHLKQLPIQITHFNKIIYKSQLFNDILNNLDREKHIINNINHNNYTYSIYTPINNHDIYQQILQQMNILICDMDGNTMIIGDMFQKSMYMLSQFISIEQILNDLIKINAISTFDLTQLNNHILSMQNSITVTITCQNHIFNLEFTKYDKLLIIRYINNPHSQIEEPINTKLLTNNQYITELDAQMVVKTTSDNIISKDMNIENVKEIYDRYKFIIKYDVLSSESRTFIISKLDINSILIDTKNKIKNNLLDITSTLSQTHKSLKYVSDANYLLQVNTQKINFTMLIIQNYLEELLLLQHHITCTTVIIYDIISNIISNLQILKISDIVQFTNMNIIKDINVISHDSLIEYLVLNCYLLAFQHNININIDINIENNHVIFRINNLTSNMIDNIYKIEYIYKRNNIICYTSEVDAIYTLTIMFNIC